MSARIAMASANVLLPEPLFPITTVRSIRGSGIQIAGGSPASLPGNISVAHYRHDQVKPQWRASVPDHERLWAPRRATSARLLIPDLPLDCVNGSNGPRAELIRINFPVQYFWHAVQM